ncbi:MAG: DUF2742 domain-containing protein [Mycolicibacterium rufum]|nr:DUF2742 domain-containing protein [Mycolicibacterium rufum]
MTAKENRPGVNRAADDETNVEPESIAAPGSSQQVNWRAVHRWVAPALTADPWPMIGTPAWRDLPDDDPRKLAAVFDAAQHWALRVEGCQLAFALSGVEISQAADWRHVARVLYDERVYDEAHPWWKRVLS